MSFGKDCNSLGIIEPAYTTASDIPIVMKPKTVGGFHRIDTLVSDAFPMAGATEISFYVTGPDTNLATVELVNTTTGSRSTIPLIPATHTTATLVTQTFTNGGGYLYRLEIIRKSTNAEYSTNLLAGPIPLADSSGAIIGFAKTGNRSDKQSSVVNLARAAKDERPGLHAYVYPNPSHDVVSISVYRTYEETIAVTSERRDNRLLLRVVSMLGTEVARYETRTGDEIDLPVRGLPKGVYFVRVEQVGNPQESGMTSFVVE